MRKILFTTFFLVATVVYTNAQLEKPVKLARPQVIKKLEAPPANLTPGKDITISIKSFQFDPNNGCSIHITYIAKNNGTEPLDVSGVVVQGFIDGPQDVPTATPPNAYFNGKNYFGGCGTSLPTNSNILSSGQEIEGVLRCFNLGKNIYYNNTNNYSYLLTIDQANKIPEANENNNSTSYSFSGYQGQYPAAAPASQYYLTEAFVIINTGADHKEQESEVNFRLIPAKQKILQQMIEMNL